MAELKRVFSSAKMNKDMDERLVPNGQYRDANNIEIATSEGSNVGTVQTILSNTQRNTIDQGGVTTSLFNSGTSNVLGPHDKSTCVASVAAPNRDRIYYFVSAGDYYSTSGLQSLRKDYIIEYNTVSEKSKYVSPLVSKSKFCALPSFDIVIISVIDAIVLDVPDSAPTSVSPT